MKGSQPAPYLPLGAKSGILGRVDATAYLETLTARLQTAGFELVEGRAGSFTFFRQTAGKAIDVNTVVVARPTVDVSPERPGAQEFVQTLKQDPRTASIPVVVISNYPRTEIVPTEGFVGKPCSPDQIIAEVMRVVKDKS